MAVIQGACEENVPEKACGCVFDESTEVCKKKASDLAKGRKDMRC